MDIGTEVWVKCAAPQVWTPGVVLECQDVGATGVVKVQLQPSGAVVTSVYAAQDDAANELCIRNKERSVHELAALTRLEYLHEPALLHALSERFAHDQIYTSIGDILVAVNPLKSLDLYGQDQIDKYKDAMYEEQDGSSSNRIRSSSTSAALSNSGSTGSSTISELSTSQPHVFAIGAKAFGGLLKTQQHNQSILVSGESGSGKTESTKFLMHFLTSVGRDAVVVETPHADDVTVEIGRRILQTNPILESFGNAQTIRNDNSSRFGKFIKIQFGAHHEIVGAEIASYLLEKVRLIHQSPGERNFHIFYELLEGADAATMEALGLKRGAKYELLNAYGGNGGPTTMAARRADALGANQFAQRFAQTVQAFDDTGVDRDEQTAIFRILAALLHLGNVNFMMVVREGKGSEGVREESAAVTASAKFHFEKCAELLGVTTTDLESLLLTRSITAGSEVMVLKQNAEQAKDICRSLAKAIYGRLFSWLVRRLSDGINYCEGGSDRFDYDAPEVQTIGILDIFGFESLDRNGFEQLCINYANERLQAQFNEFVFIKEQDVYVSEGIDWRSIPYPSNDACLSLFDDKANGLFSLLDQECLMPKGSDDALSTKFYRYHGGNENAVSSTALLKHQQSMPTYSLPNLVTSFGRYLHQPSAGATSSDPIEREPEPEAKARKPFYASKMDRVKHQFVVHHFAGKVSYKLEQFVEKNLDMLPADATTVFNASSNAIMSAIGDVDVIEQVAERAPGRRRGSLLRAPSVSAQFKSQLDRLVEEIGSTEAHYVRCLKPNEVKRPGIFDRERMVEQLRSVGVLEALRIARAGYSVRLPHTTFIELFSGFRSLVNADVTTAARKFPHAYCVSLVNALMGEVLRKNGDTVTAKPTGSFFDAANGDAQDGKARHEGVQIGKTLVFCKTETFNQFSQLRLELRERSALVLQRYYRGYRRRCFFQKLREFVHRIQSIVRGFIARKQVREMKRARQERAVNAIQRCWRKKLAFMRAVDKKIHQFRVRVAFRRFRLAHILLKEIVREEQELQAAAAVAAEMEKEKALTLEHLAAEQTRSDRHDKEERARSKQKKSHSGSESEAYVEEKASRHKKSASSSSRRDHHRHRRRQSSESESERSTRSAKVSRKKKSSSSRRDRWRSVSESESEESNGDQRYSERGSRRKPSFSRSHTSYRSRVESDRGLGSSDDDVSDHVPRRSRSTTSSRYEDHSRSRRKSSQKRKSRHDPVDDRNSKLENEILRLKQMLVEKHTSRDSFRAEARGGNGSRTSRSSSHFAPQDRYPRPTLADYQSRAGRRSLSMDELALSADEDEDGDEVSLLLPPRRSQSVYYTRQLDQVSMLSQKIEELDAKCKFLEHLVARKSFDESSRSSFAYSQRSSGSSGWDRRRFPSVIDTGYQNSTNDGQFSDTGEMDHMIRNIQQQMDTLRQTMALKEEAIMQSRRDASHGMSFSSSRRTRSSSAASSGSYSGFLGDHPIHPMQHSTMLSPSSESHRQQPSSAGSGGTYDGRSANEAYSHPQTPTSGFQTRSLSMRMGSISSVGSGMGGPSRLTPRIVKWARSNSCFECEEPFNIFVRRHHCRMCGNSFCHEHSSRRVTLLGIGFDDEPVRVCDPCFVESYAYTQQQPESSYSTSSAARYSMPTFGGSSLSSLAASHTSAA
ncbi:Myosin-like protein, partial [Globisporangium splendens]